MFFCRFLSWSPVSSARRFGTGVLELGCLARSSGGVLDPGHAEITQALGMAQVIY